MGATARPEHGPEILDQQAGLFPGSEMTTPVVHGLKDDVAHGAAPGLGYNGQLAREVAQAQFCAGIHISLSALAGLWSRVRGFVIDTHRGCRACTGMAVDTDPGQDLVWGPWMAVGPVMKLFIYPRQEADRAVRQTVAEGLWLRGLLYTVTRSLAAEPRSAGGTRAFPLRRGPEQVAEILERVGPEGGGASAYHIEVRRFHRGRIKHAHRPRDIHAPVSALCHVLRVP